MTGLRKILPAGLLISVVVCSHAQTSEGGRDRYSLLTMPFNQRQLTLYRGEMEINAGYKFAVRSLSYDRNGDKVTLTNYGTGSVYHFYFTDLKYGVTDFLEIGVETNFIRHGIRTETSTYISTTASGTSQIILNNLTETKGFGDLLLLATLRPPIKYIHFDLCITGGLFLPSSQYKPEMPYNKVTSVAASNSFIINSHYKYANGYGVPVYLVSAGLKASLKKFTIAAGFSFRTPRNEGTSIRWSGTLESTKLSYTNKSYRYLLSNEYSVNAALHYQFTGWFDFYINWYGLKTKDGWTEYWGNKYSNPGTLLVNIEPGFELQVSPHLKICQVAGFPVKGKNSEASFYLFTTIRFSSFIFGR